MKNLKNLIALCLVVAVIACNPDDNSNNQVTKLKLVDSLFLTAVENHEIPGAVAIVIQNDKIVHHSAYGWKNIEKEQSQSINDIFRIASMTKGLTAVAIMQLLENKQLQLDDPVSKYIPEFQDLQLLSEVMPDSTFTATPIDVGISIRQLLTHTSGIGYGFQDEKYNSLLIKNGISEGFCNDSRTSMENIVKIAQLPLLCEPGEKFIYSMSYDVLGVVVEVVSGQRFDVYIRKNILDPLQMKDSYFIIPDNERERLVSVYQPKEEGAGIELTKYADIEYPLNETRQFFSGGADMCSTARDYAKFVSMIKNGGTLGGTRVLGEEYVKMMLTKQTNLDDGGWDQGFSTWIANDSGAKESPMNVGSYGFGGFFDTYSWADPKEDLVAVLMLQMYPTNQHDIHGKFQELVYEEFGN